MTKFIAAYYDDWGTLGTLDHARKNAIAISRRNNYAMVYINRDCPGNPMAAVFKQGNKWIYDLRWRSGMFIIDSKTGKLKERI